MELKTSKILDIRFSEVDSMNVVWHGSYMLYFEDAREEFGRKYQLEYMRIADNGFYAPLVDMQFHYRKPITYGMRPRIVRQRLPRLCSITRFTTLKPMS